MVCRTYAIATIIFGFAILLSACEAREDVTHAPSAPATVPSSVSGRRQPDIRIVSYNVHHCARGRDRIIAALRRLDADFVLLQEIHEPDVEPLAEALKMTPAFAKNWPLASNNAQGQAIFAASRFRIENARPISDSATHACGVAVDCRIDGRRVTLMSVHLIPTMRPSIRHIRETEGWRNDQIRKIIGFWHEAGRPSLILGGDFNQLPVGPNYTLLTSTFIDAMARLDRTEHTCFYNGMESRVDYIFCTADWITKAGEVVAGDASDHRPVRADLHMEAAPLEAMHPAR
jgi:endonuclease/exonuclease/phosphatase family metal-dependent hydrolase